MAVAAPSPVQQRPRAVRALRRVQDRPRIPLRSPWSLLWVPLVAWTFFLMSNPIAVLGPFHESMSVARWSVLGAVLLSLPRLRLPYVPLSVVLVVGFMWLSTTWSMSPPLTVGTTRLYLEIAAYALVVAATMTGHAIAVGLSLGGALVAGWSLYGFVTRMPGTYYEALERVVLTGVGTNQNILAYTLVISLAATLALRLPRPLPGRLLWLVGLGASAWGILAARSASGYLTAVLIALVAGALVVASRFPASRRVWIGLLVAAAGALALGLVLVEALMGKSAATFSSRSPFWTATLATADDDLLLGHGWGTVWSHPWQIAPHNDVVQRIYDAAGLALTHGHNAFVDVVPELGLVGTALFALVVVQALHRAATAARHAPTVSASETAALVFLVVTALMGFGITEPMLTVPVGWWSIVLVASLSHRADPRPPAPGGTA